MDQQSIQQLLERLGEAISSGDFKSVAMCWEVPALFLSDGGAVAIDRLAVIEEQMSRNSEWYYLQGIIATVPQLGRMEMLSEKIAAVDVRWPYFDAYGYEKGSETSHYLIHDGKDGPRICVALSRK